MLDTLIGLALFVIQLGIVAVVFALFSLLVHRIRESHARAAYYRVMLVQLNERAADSWPEVKL